MLVLLHERVGETNTTIVVVLTDSIYDSSIYIHA